MGWFSSDRTIREYADDIWGVPVAGDLPGTTSLQARKAT
jgi:starch phosphorylase